MVGADGGYKTMRSDPGSKQTKKLPHENEERYLDRGAPLSHHDINPHFFRKEYVFLSFS